MQLHCDYQGYWSKCLYNKEGKINFKKKKVEEWILSGLTRDQAIYNFHHYYW